MRSTHQEPEFRSYDSGSDLIWSHFDRSQITCRSVRSASQFVCKLIKVIDHDIPVFLGSEVCLLIWSMLCGPVHIGGAHSVDSTVAKSVIVGGNDHGRIRREIQ